MKSQFMLSLLHAFISRLKIAKRHIKYAIHFQKLLKRHHIKNKPAPGEKEYVRFWKQLYPYVEPYSYRLFREYCGDNPFIVPEDIGHSFIEPVLNPNPMTCFYMDKNILSILLPKHFVPHTKACRIQGGGILNEFHQQYALNEKSTPQEVFAHMGGGRIILKPSVDTGGGRRVMLFIPYKDRYISYEGEQELDGAYLYEYGSNWIIQEAVEQHSFMGQLCHSAVNTMRINVYRSYLDEHTYIVSTALRIGRAGKVVDNGHAGGGLVVIDIETGKLGNIVVDECGNRTQVFNGVDYAKRNFMIPNWERIKSFCHEVARYNIHCRLISMDVALREDGSPILIEWNVAPYSFSYWIPMFTGSMPFGEKTEEIVNYCKKIR